MASLMNICFLDNFSPSLYKHLLVNLDPGQLHDGILLTEDESRDVEMNIEIGVNQSKQNA